MQKLLIIGAGGFGREVLNWALDAETLQEEWRVAGFLDENPLALESFSIPYPILGSPSSYLPAEEDVFVCAIGDPQTKLRVCEELQARGAKFITLVHPTAVIGRYNKIGQGCIFCPRSCITTNIVLGDFVTINVSSGIGHDASIGKGTTFSAFCDVTGNTVLGEGVFLGSHAVVLPSVVVGDYARIGAGSVVLRKVKPGATVMGVPAKQIAGF
jgi:sugar O-acyltransferase (sialic acid O-acetyltransferase NeuD family)